MNDTDAIESAGTPGRCGNGPEVEHTAAEANGVGHGAQLCATGPGPVIGNASDADYRNALAKARIFDLASTYAAKCRIHGQGEQVRQAWGAFVAELDRFVEGSK